MTVSIRLVRPRTRRMTGIVTETGFEGMAREGKLPAWISSLIVDIASDR
jgi:hypothetical protein